MKIHIVIVDDSRMDRYVAARVLSKFDEIEVIEEAISGDRFLETYYSGAPNSHTNGPAICVLMDINMPGLNGFETIIEMERRIKEKRGPESVVVMMLTSSSNPDDKTAADNLGSVRGYSSKPLDKIGVETIIETYKDFIASKE